jgi:hypothetical protein
VAHEALLSAGRGGSLAQCSALTVVASFSPRQASTQQVLYPEGTLLLSQGARGAVESKPLQLINGSLSGRAVERRAPWIAGLHRAADGTLAGLGICMLALSALTLHWQNQWGRSFHALEASQVLEHRMQESAALLEQHHLQAVRKPGWVVPTSSEKLIHLSAPQPRPVEQAGVLLDSLRIRQIQAGY